MTCEQCDGKKIVTVEIGRWNAEFPCIECSEPKETYYANVIGHRKIDDYKVMSQFLFESHSDAIKQTFNLADLYIIKTIEVKV